MAPARAEADDRASPADRPRFLVGLLGRGIQLSRTPTMHEAEGAAQGLCFIYRLVDTDLAGGAGPDLGDILASAELFGFDGLNVTFPYKQAIIPLLDELSEAARGLDAVNTVVLRNGRRIGHNTDMWGFAESFRREMAGAPRDSVLLLGAGGAGAAVANALLDCGVGRLLVGDLDRSRAATLVERLAGRRDAARVVIAADIAAAASRVDGIVNATPTGMAKLPGTPIEPALLRPDCWVADIVYFPLETELLAAARRRGCRVMSGQGMAVHQAARAFELFTGRPADAERMMTVFTAVGTTADKGASEELQPG